MPIDVTNWWQFFAVALSSILFLVDPVATIPSGTFAGVPAQALLPIQANRWFESCLTFNFSNAAAYAAGTFNGRAIYTLTAP